MVHGRLSGTSGIRAAAFAGVLAACAAARAGAQGVRVSLAAWTEPVLLDTMRQSHRIKAPPDSVLQAVLRAFDALGVPSLSVDKRAGIVSSERFERTRVLGGAPMSRSFDCGEGPAGPNADLFRIEMVVVAWVAPSEGGTTLSLATVASGRDVSGVFRQPKPCASTGGLETRLLDRVNKILGY